MLHHEGFVSEHVIPALLELRQSALMVEHEFKDDIERTHTGFRDSARNLAHYLAIRRMDIRDIQDELTYMGLSSLGRSESCTMVTLENVLDLLHRFEGKTYTPEPPIQTTVDARTGPMYLSDHARRLFGDAGGKRQSRIMVTMPTTASTDPGLVRDLVEAGMDIMRINCAHDSPAEWKEMVVNLRRAEQETGRQCKVYVDLAGPKLRIGTTERIRVHVSDIVTIVKGACENEWNTPCVPCTLEEVFDDVAVGERVWFDDGKIGGVIRTVSPDRFSVEVTHAKPSGAWLKAGKGINLPDTSVSVPSITSWDDESLRAMAGHADIIGMSFVRSEADVSDLFQRLQELKASDRGIVIKIETRGAFERLPYILMHGLRHPPFGIMVARGDLAVEVGYDRLAEVQEEILWLCEAAHVPVIWATQVLEGMARKGVPTRAEVSDAALSVRAECVMLNKGPHIVKTVAFLSDVLERMAAHQSKKRTLLRKLKVSEPLM